jgi:2-dehydro-3-deoxyphosphooctonate aldolase (KDO 8-P synthase)
MLIEVAETLVPLAKKNNIPLIFKASYRKANRSSQGSFQGIGDRAALEDLAEIRLRYGVPILTDFHTAEEARTAAEYVDVLQVPAFLSRQTDILESAAQTGKVVNIKKGQFMAPDDMKKAADKVRHAGNNSIWLTERGTSFGYHDLVVDYRGLVTMRETGYPVIYDATHSVQQPSIGSQSGGQPQFIPALARAAVAVGVQGIFFETHPNPAQAKSDSATQLPLNKVPYFLAELIAVRRAVEAIHG